MCGIVGECGRGEGVEGDGSELIENEILTFIEENSMFDCKWKAGGGEREYEERRRRAARCGNAAERHPAPTRATRLDPPPPTRS